MVIDENSVILPVPGVSHRTAQGKAYHIELPGVYKQFLKTHNGAKPVTNTFRLREREYLVERFLCLLDEPKENAAFGWYDLTSVLTQLDSRLIDDEDPVGMNVIPIAALYAGDFVCLDYRTGRKPCVVIWFHEESDEFAPVTEKAADDIGEFFDMLEE